MLAFVDGADGGGDVNFHRLMVVFVRGGDGLVHLLNRLDALAVLVVLRVLKIVLRLFEMDDGVLGVPGFFELDERLVHLGLRGVHGLQRAGEGGRGAECGGAACDKEGLGVGFHGGSLDGEDEMESQW